MLEIVQGDNIKLSRTILDNGEEYEDTVKNILKEVRLKGDEALFQFTKKFDQVEIDYLKVTAEEIDEAYAFVPDEVVAAIQKAAKNIKSYHEQQKRQSWVDTKPSGTILGQLIRPLNRVGIYVPGGRAAYPSSVLMNAIPAQVAGVKEIVMISPPNKEGKLNPGVLVAANELGITEIYKVGGAQGIAALAYGTETIQKVDKITGPGNIYVALAKKEVFGFVDIDMVAGPSEIVVLADEHANPEYVAADLLSQAEHDPLSAALLITDSKALAETVQREVKIQLENLERREIAAASLKNNGKIYVVSTLEKGIELINDYAPEHLEVMVDDPFSYVGKIKNAGAIFLGKYSAEVVGDYFAGPNHILPTGGTAAFSSPLNVDDFLKKTSLISYSKADLEENGELIQAFANYEQLQAHANAIKVRMKKEK